MSDVIYELFLLENIKWFGTSDPHVAPENYRDQLNIIFLSRTGNFFIIINGLKLCFYFGNVLGRIDYICAF